MTNPIPPVELTPHSALIEAWCRWDELPGDARRAYELSAAVVVYAAELGIGTNELRQRMAAGRRAGLSHDTALDQVRNEVRSTHERSAA